MANILEQYFTEFYLKFEKYLKESLLSIGINVDSENEIIRGIFRNAVRNGLIRYVFPDGGEEWRYNDILLLKIIPLESPSVGFKIIQYKKKT